MMLISCSVNTNHYISWQFPGDCSENKKKASYSCRNKIPESEQETYSNLLDMIFQPNDIYNNAALITRQTLFNLNGQYCRESCGSGTVKKYTATLCSSRALAVVKFYTQHRKVEGPAILASVAHNNANIQVLPFIIILSSRRSRSWCDRFLFLRRSKKNDQD